MPETDAPYVMAVANQKGGVGKTTTAINLAAEFAKHGYSTLLIDLDPQGNASTGLGIQKGDRTLTSFDVLIGDTEIAEATFHTTVDNLDIVPATVDLSSVDVDLVQDSNRLVRLVEKLGHASLSPYTFVLIDCPPSLNLLTLNGLIAADSVLVPLQCEFFALEGLSQLMLTIREVRQAANPRLKIQGIVLTMYDQRNNLSRQVELDVRSNLGELVFRTVIPRNIRLSEAPSYGLPGVTYDPRSAGAEAYGKLATELLSKLGQQIAA